jgi:hypothetical protein
VLKSAFDPSEPWILDNIDKLEDRLNRLAHIIDAEGYQKTADDMEAIKAILSTLRDPIKRVVNMADVALKMVEESDFLQCLRWLSPIPVFEHHEMQSSNRIAGTGKWLFDHPRYRDWNDSSSSSMLTLHGVPGCGKSSIASAITDSVVSNRDGQTSFTPLAYFYCTRNTFEVERSNPDDIMRSLLRQLATSKHTPGTIHDAVFSIFKLRRSEANLSGFNPRKLKQEECVNLILELTESNPAVIVIDAIDEVAEDGESILLNALKRLLNKSANVMKVFVTSRTHSHILALVDSDLTIHVDRNNVKNDIERLTNHLLTLAIDEKRLLRGKVSDELRAELQDSLVQSAGEM